MTPAARVQTAAELLDDIFAGAPAEQVLTRWARASRFAGSKDRAALRDLVYDALRRRRSALPMGMAESGRALMIGLASQDGADLNALFDGSTYGPGALSQDERAVRCDAEAHDVPEWILPRLRDALGEKFEANLAAMRHRAPVFLRVNLRKGGRAAAQGILQDDGIEADLSSLADTALEVTEGARRVAQSRAYRDGLVELQDASSQAAIAQLEIPEGARVLDLCAGGGGKTLAMAGRAKARFFAHDVDAGRMRDLPIRAKRAGVDVRCLDKAAVKGEAPYDLVFCDVPCSGSGTWRRTPDAKWRFDEADLLSLLPIQVQILDEAEALVGQGGRLVYATCSLLPEENSAQVEGFLGRHPGWQCVETRQWRLDEGCDGFYMAQLRRA